ncbi:SMEK domain-containing protein [Salmonella enterica]|uniref:SMEK domain-containing protein n=1 Tax=Klebsiella pneumoniae TaxID=573 RepID=UPI0024A7AB53|nr:SMEK domain-containing protein [Klebsiella pneumoniae]EDE9709721.1 SMEK domain-containing protein [Salmonella enterica]EJD1357952.1 SMEK domain-containing protein [Salmonella enterica]EJU4360257.1 SMEK domain-containing protein [Salmonella enterica]EJV8514472.1 SMEK domain-containing protein [Salmonella enterica]EJV8515437.1 SMEK domain-containing protein [Salmonella enterica]
MLARAENIRKITNYLAVLSREVEINASLNLLDINVQVEFFYRDFLNLCFGYNLRNTNSEHQNYQAIDLADENMRVAIQVTSTPELEKIKNTVDGFIKKKQYEKYDRLIVLNITKRKNYKVKEYGVAGRYVINIKDDVWDYRDIIRKINDLNDIEISAISSFLERNITTSAADKPPKEVTTMFAMIELLSDDDHPLAGNGFIEEPNPENKIYKRFSDYSEQLIGLYIGLAPLYSGIFKSIKEQSDIGIVKYKKMSLYLESFSDKVLRSHDANPILALNSLIEYFSKQLSQRNVDYDETAIKFFLIENLIACNVFPNSEIL